MVATKWLDKEERDMGNRKKAAAGRKGGLVTAGRYGPSHMAEIGRQGAQVTHEKYRMQPLGTSGWAMVDRDTDKVVAVMGTRPW